MAVKLRDPRIYGASPITQPSGSTQAAVVTTLAVSSSSDAGHWGFSTSTQANSIVTLVNKMRADLVTLGLIKGSA